MAAAALSHWANALALGEAGAWIKLAAAVAGVAVLARKLRRLSQHKHTVELTRKTKLHPQLDDECKEYPAFPNVIRNQQNMWLVSRAWEVAEPVAVCFFAHGFGEHSGRYEHLGRFLNAQRVSLYALDHQGHGCSEGDRAHVESFQSYVDDFLQFVRTVQSDAKFAKSRPPAFLMGHSMGGAIAILSALDSEKAGVWPWRGVILSSPAVRVHPDLAAPWKIAVGRVIASWLPRLVMEKPLGPEKTSRSRLNVERYATDPLIYHGGMMAGWALQMLDAMARVEREAPRFTLPFLLLQGGADIVCEPQGATAFYARASTPEKLKKLVMLEGLFHEVLLEPERGRVLAIMLEWIRERVAARE